MKYLRYCVIFIILINEINCEIYEKDEIFFKNIHNGTIHQKVEIIRKQKKYMDLPDDCRFGKVYYLFFFLFFTYR